MRRWLAAGDASVSRTQSRRSTATAYDLRRLVARTDGDERAMERRPSR
jgi:hypothetical protein